MNERKTTPSSNIESAKEIAELYVVIDTLQTNLRSAVGYLSDEDKDKIINVQSYKWCTNWQQGDEKNV